MSLPDQPDVRPQTTQREEFSTGDDLAQGDAASLKQISFVQEDHHSHRTQTASQVGPGQVATEGSVPVGSAPRR
jgi:hypothetical protein